MEGNGLKWIEMDKKIDTTMLYYKALNQNICFAPGSLFTASGLYAHCLRIGCGDVWSDVIESAIVRLGTLACEELANQQSEET